jgi:hypothetical protein
VRYWVNGEDENYERELERVSRFGVPPAPMSPSDVAGVVLLVGTQAVLLTSVIVAFVLRLGSSTDEVLKNLGEPKNQRRESLRMIGDTKPSASANCLNTSMFFQRQHSCKSRILGTRRRTPIPRLIGWLEPFAFRLF